MRRWLVIVALTLLPVTAEAGFLDVDRLNDTRYITAPNPVSPLFGGPNGIQVQPPVTPVQPQPVIPIGGSNNTCDLAFNNICNEPTPCAAGTDGHDCAPGNQK